MNIRTEDQELEKRTKTLGDVATDLAGNTVQVQVPLREQIVERLYKRMVEQDEGLRTRDLWNIGNSERAGWLTKMQGLLRTFDEFIEPIYDATNDWSSTLHLPVVYNACKTYHARFLAALLAIDPPFTVKARQAHNVDRAMLIQELMRYELNSHINEHKGVEEQVDRWIWRWITAGSAILKARWHRRFVRFVDVVEKRELRDMSIVQEFGGQPVATPVYDTVEVEEEVLQEVFNGPMLEHVPIEDVLLIGGQGDPQAADDVIQMCYMTASELYALADQGVFKRDAVERVIKAGEQYRSAEMVNQIKDQQLTSVGSGQLDRSVDVQRYQILERYARLDVDGSGIASEVVLWVHSDTGELLRATYLHRINKAGLRPFFKIDFHIRENAEYGTGLPELLYSLAREIDAFHNMRTDFGLISSIPFGFYRPTSSVKEERMPLEPGVLIPLDNPQADVFFPQLGNKTQFALQEEQMLYQMIERITSISDLSLGVIGGQGAARTATGARALLGESNANLDVFLRRMNRGWRQAIQYLFKLLQERLPDGYQFRLLGDDGSMFWETVRSKAEIAGEYDFELEANSANSNKAIQIEQANSMLMTIANPLFLQMGIVTAANIFQALKTKMQVEGVRDWARYITKPTGQEVVYTPEQIANAALAGVNIPLNPMQDLQGFIDYFNTIINTDELLGQFSEQQTIQLARKAQEAEAMLAAIQQQAAQQANAQQMSMNASMASAPSPQSAGMAGGGQAPTGGGAPA